MDLVYVIGPPRSGKSTYVEQHRRPPDVVVDFDAMAVAMGSGAAHGQHAEQHAMTTYHAWQAAVRYVEHSPRLPNTAWIIHAEPSDAQRRAYRRLGRVVDMERRRPPLVG